MVELPFGKSGQLFASAMPYSRYDPNQSLLGALQAYGVSRVIMLVSDAEASSATGLDLRRLYEQQGLQVLQMPVPDLQVPDRAALEDTLGAVGRALESGQRLVVHCHAGLGRTGLFAACLAKRLFGMPGSQALSWVRQYIPGAVETDEQERFILNF